MSINIHNKEIMHSSIKNAWHDIACRWIL